MLKSAFIKQSHGRLHLASQSRIVLGDFSYVTGVCDERLSVLSRLPFVGPGWYHRVAVENLLHYGKIRWRHIAHSLSSTGKLPAGSFRGPLEKMEAAWDDPALATRAVNVMVETRPVGE